MCNRRVIWNKSSDALEWLPTMTLEFNAHPRLRSSNSNPVVLLLSLEVKYRHYEVHLRERDCKWVHSGQGNVLCFLFSWGFFPPEILFFSLDSRTVVTASTSNFVLPLLCPLFLHSVWTKSNPKLADVGDRTRSTPDAEAKEITTLPFVFPLLVTLRRS